VSSNDFAWVNQRQRYLQQPARAFARSYATGDHDGFGEKVKMSDMSPEMNWSPVLQHSE
jgi:hypothetical protein